MKKILLILSVVIIFFVSLCSCSFAARKPLASNFGTDTTGTDPTKLNISEGNVVLDTVTQNWRVYYTLLDGSTTYYNYEPATRVNVVVQSEVSFDTVNNNYIYNYTLNSLSNSTQKVDMLVVYDITSSISNIIVPSGWFYLFSEGDTDIMWANISTGLIPGTSTTGFQFESPYLPSIVSCWTQGVVPDIVITEEYEMYPDVTPNLDGDSVRGKTIGPRVFTSPIISIDSATTFINTMTSYIEESYVQGWIESNTILRDKYKRLLQDCRTALTKHNKHLATMKLQQLIDTAETDFTKQRILSEAYALIKYNALFLRNQLPNMPYSRQK